YFCAKDNVFEPVEVILPQNLVSPVVTGTFSMRIGGPRLRVVIAYDRVGNEIFDKPDDG
ncbi:hypothetical protein FRC07_003788, partial [Ceratobasidium sp. 392]